MKKNQSKSIEFSCHAPEAKAVFVAGTFNGWKVNAAPLRLDSAKGHWTGTLQLPPGHHEFKFVVDGRWCCEPGCEQKFRDCPKCVANDLGTMNRTLEVR